MLEKRRMCFYETHPETFTQSWLEQVLPMITSPLV